MLCVECKEEPAILSPIYGLLPCDTCRETVTVRRPTQLTPQHIKDQRKEGHDDLIQPFRKGILSKEYLKKYGTKYIRATPDEIKRAKNVWGRDTGGFYKDGD